MQELFEYLYGALPWSTGMHIYKELLYHETVITAVRSCIKDWLQKIWFFIGMMVYIVK
jgi:hypothetical protein